MLDSTEMVDGDDVDVGRRGCAVAGNLGGPKQRDIGCMGLDVRNENAIRMPQYAYGLKTTRCRAP
jgi:hypothetical protein